MKVQQTIEIHVAGPKNEAFSQIVMGTKRSAQKRHKSLEDAIRDCEQMITERVSASITWTKPVSKCYETVPAMVGSYEFEVPEKR